MASRTETIAAAADEAPNLEGTARGAYGVYVTFLIVLIWLFGAMDRNNLAILLVPIQKEFGASDTEMGILAGTAFSVVYAVAALPLARFADTGNRRNLIGAAVAVWSVMTALCGVANSYITMLLCRIGVATGEAGYGPATYSMIGDLFPRNRRGLAMAFTQVGSAIGLGLGAYFAGAVGDLYGWRVAFLAMGLPGILLAILVFFTMREPRRGAFDKITSANPPSTMEAIRHIFGVPTIRRLVTAKIAQNLATGGLLAWLPAFFMRVHGLTATEMSAGFGISIAAGSITAALLGGTVTDRLSRRGERWRSYWCAASLLGGVPFAIACMIVPTANMAFFCFFMMMVMGGGITATSTVAALIVVRPDVRGLMSAVVGLCVSLIGLGMGPMVFGAMNDWFRADHGDDGVRYTLLAVPVMWTIASFFFYMAGRTTDEDARRVLGTTD